ncbi:MAG: hypothetical protein Tsb0014_35770 [Pleurocapsa sp.]
MSNLEPSPSERVPLILVVDDDRTMRSLLNLALQEEGYQVVEAKNGEQGLAEYSRLQPDMVLLDAVMPDMDGFQCCDRIRQLPQGDLIPILMITVLDDRNSIEQAFTVGATDYITKPLHWEVLSHRVRRMLAGYQATLETQKVRQQIQTKQAWEENFSHTLHLLWQSSDLEPILPTILTQIQQFFQGENVFIWQQENQDFLSSELAKSPLSSEINQFISNFTLDSQSVSQYQQKTTIAIAAVNQSELLPTLETSLANFRIAIAPIIIHNQFWGLLGAINGTQWQLSQVEQFSELAKLLTVAIKKICEQT